MSFRKPQVQVVYESVNKWKEIRANDFIVDVIENGYEIPFLTLPNQIELDNNKSARDNSDFVTDEINKLLVASVQ